VPPEDISSSYSYQICAISFFGPDGIQCILYIPTVMDVLKITPPFTYSYQCGSTLLTSYLPIYMYSISLQIMSTFVKLMIIFAANASPQSFPWIKNWLPAICWPLDWNTREVILNNFSQSQPCRLVEPYRIITSVMENLMLLLSFGLCCPVLSLSIMINVCLHGSCWLMLIGRFLSSCLDQWTIVLSPSPGHVFTREKQSNDDIHKRDFLIALLTQQLQCVNASLVVCKWPLILTSCAFVTVLSWDMVGIKWVGMRLFGFLLLVW
jgi:hypothetical protein